MEASKLSCPPICRPISSFNKGGTFSVQGHVALPPLLALNFHKQCRAPKFYKDLDGLPRRKGMLEQFRPGPRHASQVYLLKPCKVKSEDTEGTLTGENIILDEQTLEQDLQHAIKEENYARAAEIRDTLRSLQNDSKAAVLAANARFYSAFRNGNLAAMQALWSKGDNVCVVHPGVSGISGYDSVMGSWEIVWAEYDFPLQIDILDVQVHVKGDVGYVTCIEKVKTKGSSWGKQFATNVFEKIDGQWHISVHHASYVDL